MNMEMVLIYHTKAAGQGRAGMRPNQSSGA